jgi:predicted house-cleaning NTP pyrophosphatase (Maf/HAM1 superfamily)
MRIILGSQSPRRLEILRSVVPVGTCIDVLPADIDEKAIRHTSASALTMAIAREKNEAVRQRLSGATRDVIVITADTVAQCNDDVREKPVDARQLRVFVESYNWFPVFAITSVWVHNIASGWCGSVTDSACVKFNRFTNEELDAIIRDTAFYGSAGGFLIEHPLMKHKVRRVLGDPETVQGLPGRMVELLIADAIASS